MGIESRAYLRFPIPRNEFVDPPPANWTAAKANHLWDLLRQGKELNNIESLAQQFGVSTAFIHTQVVYLYNKELENLQSSMKRLSYPDSSDQKSLSLHLLNEDEGADEKEKPKEKEHGSEKSTVSALNAYVLRPAAGNRLESVSSEDSDEDPNIAAYSAFL